MIAGGRILLINFVLLQVHEETDVVYFFFLRLLRDRFIFVPLLWFDVLLFVPLFSLFLFSYFAPTT